MAPSTTTAALLSLLALSPLAAAGSNHRAFNKRHASIAARRSAGEFDVVERRSSSLPVEVKVMKKRDGTTCKARPVSAAPAAATTAPQSEAPAAEPTASPVVAAVVQESPASSAAPDSSAAPAPTEEAAAEPSSTAAEPAPTSSQVEVAAPAQSSPAAQSNNNSGGGATRKAGLAWPNGNSDNPQTWATQMGGSASWYYTWSPWPVAELSPMEFVPMLWGWKQVGEWQQNIGSYKDLGVKHALFVNEPNGSGQANMNVGSGCELWNQQFEQLRSMVPGIQLGSAAPDSAPAGKQWLEDFRSQCPQAQPDFYALHWYDVKYEDFQSYVLDFATTFQKPLWVTEYACQNFNGGAQCETEYIRQDFFAGTTQWMNSRPEVARHSAFGAMLDLQGVNTANALMDGNGFLTELGSRYAAAY